MIISNVVHYVRDAYRVRKILVGINIYVYSSFYQFNIMEYEKKINK